MLESSWVQIRAQNMTGLSGKMKIFFPCVWGLTHLESGPHLLLSPTLGIYSLFKIKVGVNNGLWLAETGQRAQYWPLIGRDLNTGLRRWRSWSQLMPNAINESISRIYCKQKLYHLSCYPVIIQSNQLVTTEMQTSSGNNLIINLSPYSIPDLTTRDSRQWHGHSERCILQLQGVATGRVRSRDGRGERSARANPKV